MSACGVGERASSRAQYLTNGEVAQFGRLMRESHRSLSDLFEVSCRELDVMAEIAQDLKGYRGGRMTGGGFGGCTVNLVTTESSEKFVERIADRYRSATGIHPDIYVCSASNGASAGLALASQGKAWVVPWSSLAFFLAFNVAAKILRSRRRLAKGVPNPPWALRWLESIFASPNEWELYSPPEIRLPFG